MKRAVAVAAAALALASCGKDGAAGKKAGAKGPLLVRVAEARVERVERIVELTGTLGGAEEVTVVAEIDGRVERVAADLGDPVDQGALLVQLADAEPRLRHAQAEAEYLQALARLGVDDDGLGRFQPESMAVVRRAEADLAEAKRNFGRGEELRRRELAAEGELDALRTRLRIAEAAHKFGKGWALPAALEEARGARAIAMARRAAAALARKKVKDTSIASPVRGFVARRHVALGAYVRAGEKIADVVVVDPLVLRGEAAERYVGAIRPGMTVRLRVDALDGRAVEGKVSRVGPAISTSTRTFPLEAELPNADGALRPGLFARAEIEVGADEQVVAVPETAVSSVAGVTKVFVEEDGKARERPVQVLRKRGSDALLAGPLEAGDRVILTAIARLFDGADVQVDGSAVEPAPEAKPASAEPGTKAAAGRGT